MRAAALLLLLAGAASAACGGEQHGQPEARIIVDAQLKSDLETLRGARVFFGHHSVGANLLEGLAALARESGIEVPVGEGPVGRNQDPLSKFEDFARHAESPATAEEQLLLMKLCYVDFTPETDVRGLLDAYAQAVERARKARPAARIVHVTPPLTVRPTDMKSKLKRTLGKTTWEDDANLRRMEYSEQLQARFPGEPLLDLARIESTRPDGTREEHEVGGRQVPMLWPGYTSDGGHLNEAGKLLAAREFARVLARALRG